MLEARTASSGATGRNGGHTKAASYRSFLAHEADFGTEEAVRIARLEESNIRATHAFAREYDVKCDSRECPTVDIVYCPKQLAQGKKAIERMRKVMGRVDPAAAYVVYGAREAREKFRCPDALGAFEYGAGSLSAYAFAVGVLKLSLDRGLNLQTETPALEISSSATAAGQMIWSVRTPRGTVKTRNLILATNGYTAHLLPSMQSLIVPLHGQVCAQRPGLALPQTGLEHTYSFIHETGYEYMISRPAGSVGEGDIVIGGGLWVLPREGASRYGNTDDAELDPDVTKFLRGSAQEFFGEANWGQDHADGRVKKEWSGIMGASADGLPYVGPVPAKEGLWISASFNGHGMVWCLKAAEALVETMIGGAVPEWFPRSALLSKERMALKFTGRQDLKAPGEASFGERESRL